MAQSTTDGELDPVTASGGSAAIEAATGLTAAAVTKTSTTESNAAVTAAGYPVAEPTGLAGLAGLASAAAPPSASASCCYLAGEDARRR